MKSKAVLGIMLTPLLISMLTLAFDIQPVRAEPATWTVDDDGPADFHTIQEAVNAASDGDTVLVRAGTYYEEVLIKGKSISLIGEDPSTTLIDRMLGGIPIEVRIAERVNITGFTVMNSGAQWRSNMFFEEWPESGILLWNSDECNVHGNIVKYNYYGVTIYSSWPESNYNSVSDNLIANNSAAGIFLEGHVETGLVYSETTIIENTITNNWAGLSSYLHSDNRICHNSFIDNTLQTLLTTGYTHIWDDGYPSGGNYWSDYSDVDLLGGPYQNETGSDGIGDTPYLIDANNTDHYPLINPWTTTETHVNMKDKDYPVTIVSNTTLDQIIATANTLHFKSSGPEGEKGYVNVIFPMVNVTRIKVFIDGEKLIPPPFPLINSNGTHYFIYFEFTLSIHEIDIQYSIQGDATGDGYVNVLDLGLLSDAWLTMSGEPGFDPNCDFNFDGFCNILDLGIMSDHWLFDGDEWDSFTPSSEMVSLVFWMLDGISYVNATITFLYSGYDISYWGTVVREGQQIWVNSGIWIRTIGFVLPYVWELSHTYNLGNLEQGDYTFTFKAWNAIVKSIDFNVG